MTWASHRRQPAMQPCRRLAVCHFLLHRHTRPSKLKRLMGRPKWPTLILCSYRKLVMGTFDCWFWGSSTLAVQTVDTTSTFLAKNVPSTIFVCPLCSCTRQPMPKRLTWWTQKANIYYSAPIKNRNGYFWPLLLWVCHISPPNSWKIRLHFWLKMYRPSTIFDFLIQRLEAQKVEKDWPMQLLF